MLGGVPYSLFSRPPSMALRAASQAEVCSNLKFGTGRPHPPRARVASSASASSFFWLNFPSASQA